MYTFVVDVRFFINFLLVWDLFFNLLTTEHNAINNISTYLVKSLIELI